MPTERESGRLTASDAWDKCPIVFRTRDHCPRCLGVRPLLIRSGRNGDGSQTRRYMCRQCSRRFVIVIEPPVFGGDDEVDR